MRGEDCKIVIVKPDRDGFSPKLSAGEVCQDTIDKLWHLCTPVGSVMTLVHNRMTRDKDRRLCIKLTPRNASLHLGQDGLIDNIWTITSGVWHKL